MSPVLSVKDLRQMSSQDLLRDINDAKSSIAKVRLGITLGKEKNHAVLRRMRRDIARMETVLAQTRANGLKNEKSPATIAAPKKETTQKKITQKKRTASRSTSSSAS